MFNGEIFKMQRPRFLDFWHLHYLLNIIWNLIISRYYLFTFILQCLSKFCELFCCCYWVDQHVFGGWFHISNGFTFGGRYIHSVFGLAFAHPCITKTGMYFQRILYWDFLLIVPIVTPTGRQRIKNTFCLHFALLF